MMGIEISHGNAAIDAILASYYALMESTVEEALRPSLTYGKPDTRGLDAIPEITILEYLRGYDTNAVMITEERGAEANFELFVRESDPRVPRTFFISDPTDRSAQLTTFLQAIGDHRQQVKDALHGEAGRHSWEVQYSAPAEITGPSSAITCVRRGVPIFSVMVNYLTEQLFVSCSAGNYVLSLPRTPAEIDLDDIRMQGTKISFRKIGRNQKDLCRFITFLGKKGYKENFIDSQLMTEAEMREHLPYDLPGGPLRILYLSSLQPEDTPFGFILANGEKLVEWVHWLTFIRFARLEGDQSEPALRLFEIFQDRPWTKEGVLMATPPAYSIFRPQSAGNSRMVIDLRRLADFNNPSKVRSTLLVAPRDNEWATRVVKQYGYRTIEFAEE